MKKFREFEAWSLRVNPLIKPKKINWPDAWKCPLSSITLLRLVHSFFPFQDKSYYPLAWQVFLVNSSHHKALFILIRCTKGKRERAVAKKLSASRKTWAFPRHRFISIFQPREKGENLKGCRRAKWRKETVCFFFRTKIKEFTIINALLSIVSIHMLQSDYAVSQHKFALLYLVQPNTDEICFLRGWICQL